MRMALVDTLTLPQGIRVTSPRYVASFTYQLSPDAHGVFSIELPNEPQCNSRDQVEAPIPFITSGATIVVPSGACCHSGNCLGVMTEYDCDVAGGTFAANTTCETDRDGDGTSDCADGCADDPNKIAPGQCGCGVADSDSDADGIVDCIDNCPLDPNSDQRDLDHDGVGDICQGPDAPIPTIGQWGLAIMTLLLLVCGKVQFGRQHRRPECGTA